MCVSGCSGKAKIRRGLYAIKASRRSSDSRPSATADAGPKMEGWHVRHGWVYVYGEGTPTPGGEERIPSSHKECAVARTEKKLLPGDVASLTGAEQWHWMRAGDEGAIVTEYATYHDGNGLRFSHPKASL